MTLVNYRKKNDNPGEFNYSVDTTSPNYSVIKDIPGNEFKYADAPPTSTPSPTPFLTSSANNPVTSSDAVRQSADLTKAAAANGLGNFTNWDDIINKQLELSLKQQTFGQSDQGKAAQDNLEQIRKNLGIFTDAENKQIEEAGQAGAAEYQPLINEAMRSKEQGLPKALIGGGERGGFMNTQFAGQAALVPTNGGDFIGVGGELENIKSVYDNNISNLKAKQQSAALAAKEAYRQALRTGKRQDYDLAEKAFQTAKSSFDEANALVQEKVAAVSKYQTQRQARISYDFERLQKIGEVGGTVPDEVKTSLDAAYGPGFTDKYAAASKAAKDVSTEEKQIEAMSKITDILKNYPLDQEIKIGSATYKGIANNKDNQIFQEEDAGGNVTFITIDKKTGEIIHVASGGKIGKGVTKNTGTPKIAGLPEADVQDLLNSRGSDGYVATDKYAKLYDQAVLKGSKVLQAFLDQVPVSTYLNPKDPMAERFIRTRGQTLPKNDRYTEKDIPNNLYQEILDNIKSGQYNVTDIQSTYNDVDPGLIATLFRNNAQ